MNRARTRAALCGLTLAVGAAAATGAQRGDDSLAVVIEDCA